MRSALRIAAVALALAPLGSQPSRAARLTQFADISMGTSTGIDEDEPSFTLDLGHGAQFSKLDPAHGTLSGATMPLVGELTPTIEEDDSPVTFSTSTETSLSVSPRTVSHEHSFDVEQPTSSESADLPVHETLTLTGADLAAFVGTGTVDVHTAAELAGTIDNPDDCDPGTFHACRPRAHLDYSGRLSADYEFAVPGPGTPLLLGGALRRGIPQGKLTLEPYRTWNAPFFFLRAVFWRHVAGWARRGRPWLLEVST